MVFISSVVDRQVLVPTETTALLGDPSIRIPKVRFYAIFMVIWMGTFLAALDSTITTTLTVPLLSIFKDPSLLSWIGTSYFVSSAVVTPLCGQLTDQFSRRAGFVLSFTIFAVGNLIFGMANDPYVLIAGRVLAGVGGGGLNAISSITVNDLVSMKDRGLWQGATNMAFGIGHALGALCGGLANDFFDWRMAFFPQVALALLLAILSACLIHFPKDQRKSNTTKDPISKTVDWKGAMLLTFGLTLLLLGINWGTFSEERWLGWKPIPATLLGALVIGIFSRYSVNYRENPIIPVASLKIRTVGGVCAINWLTSAGFAAIEFFLPILSQLTDSSAYRSGLLLIPISVGGAVGSVAVGFHLKLRPQHKLWTILCTIVLLCVGISAFIPASLEVPRAALVMPALILGFGYAGSLTSSLTALLNAVDSQDRATVTSMNYCFRSVGSAIGVTIGSMTYRGMLSLLLPSVLPDEMAGKQHIQAFLDGLDELEKLDANLRGLVLNCYERSLHVVFGVSLAICFSSLLFCFLLRRSEVAPEDPTKDQPS